MCTVQEAVFGVLYKLSKERLFEGWRFVLSAMVIDYLQVCCFVQDYVIIGYSLLPRFIFCKPPTSAP